VNHLLYSRIIRGSIAFIENPVHRQHSKHIDIKYHFVHDHCNQGNVNVVHKPLTDMIADILTKPMS